MTVRVQRVPRSTRYQIAIEAARLVLLHYLDEGALAMSRYQLTRTVPALRAREVAGMLQYQQAFREFIHEWMGGGLETALRAELMAGAVVTAHNYVLRRWLRGLTDDPGAEFDDAMVTTVELFAERQPRTGAGSLVVFQTDKDIDAVLPALRTLLGDPSVEQTRQERATGRLRQGDDLPRVAEPGAESDQ